MPPIENPRAMNEILNQIKRIDKNNWNNNQYLNSINMLFTSNDLGTTKDDELNIILKELNNRMEDVNKLTSDLLDGLSKKHNCLKP